MGMSGSGGMGMSGSGGMGMSGSGGMGMSGSGGASGAGKAGEEIILDVDGKPIPYDFLAARCDFVVQFVWKPRFEKDGGKNMVGGMPVVEAVTPNSATDSSGSTPTEIAQ
jgi:hypothetical protein